MEYIYRSNGTYLGFLSDSNIFSRDGIYLGWIENNHVWDKEGIYRGDIYIINGQKYILKYLYIMPPIPKTPKATPNTPSLPSPVGNISPVNLKIGFVDGF